MHTPFAHGWRSRSGAHRQTNRGAGARFNMGRFHARIVCTRLLGGHQNGARSRPRVRRTGPGRLASDDNPAPSARIRRTVRTALGGPWDAPWPWRLVALAAAGWTTLAGAVGRSWGRVERHLSLARRAPYDAFAGLMALDAIPTAAIGGVQVAEGGHGMRDHDGNAPAVATSRGRSTRPLVPLRQSTAPPMPLRWCPFPTPRHHAPFPAPHGRSP